MIKSSFQLMVIVVLVFAFIGQSFAAATVSCQMMMKASAMTTNLNVVDHQAMGHQSMMHESMAHSTNNEMSAAQTMQNMLMADNCIDCECPASACSFISFVTVGDNLIEFEHFIDKISTPRFFIAQTQIKSLYRPPIFS